jgi:hypothetical protein
MLNQSQKNVLDTVKEIGTEIDAVETLNNLRWAICSIAHLARKANDINDKNDYFTQIEVISDCMAWIAKINDVAFNLKAAERMEDVQA